MFKGLKGKFKKIKMPDEPLIKKLENIKKTAEVREVNYVPDISNQLKQMQEEATKKTDELVNSKLEQIKADIDAVKNIESQLSKIDQSVNSNKKSMEEFKEKLAKMDETVLDLLSMYEVISNASNPFVDKADVAEKFAEIERKLGELSNKAPDMPENLAEEIDNKFKALENNIETLKKNVELRADENALVEKVSNQVLERIKLPAGETAQREAAPISQSDEGGIRLPYLDSRPETPIVLLNWIEFLMEKVGRNNLSDVLEYYIEIGWISEEVSSKMMAYADGIDYYVEKPVWKLLPEDHVRSLLFIEQLRGRKIDKNLYLKLERDVGKIIHGSKVMVT